MFWWDTLKRKQPYLFLSLQVIFVWFELPLYPCVLFNHIFAWVKWITNTNIWFWFPSLIFAATALFPNSINACCTERFVYSAMQLFFQNNYSGNMCNVSLCHCTAKAFINNVLLHAIVQLINLSAQWPLIDVWLGIYVDILRENTTWICLHVRLWLGFQKI